MVFSVVVMFMYKFVVYFEKRNTNKKNKSELKLFVVDGYIWLRWKI